MYRFQKAIRRNKLAYAAALAVTAALLAGITASVWQAKVAIRALGETEKSRIAEKEQRLAAQKERRFSRLTVILVGRSSTLGGLLHTETHPFGSSS